MRLRIEDGVAWVGDRRMPEGTKVVSHDHRAELPEHARIVESRQRSFDLPFENGWTMTVDWGRLWLRVGRDVPFVEEPEAATVAVSDRDGRVVVWDETGSPLGKSLDHPGQLYEAPAARILDLVDAVASWPSDHLVVLDRV